METARLLKASFDIALGPLGAQFTLKQEGEGLACLLAAENTQRPLLDPFIITVQGELANTTGVIDGGNLLLTYFQLPAVNNDVRETVAFYRQQLWYRGLRLHEPVYTYARHAESAHSIEFHETTTPPLTIDAILPSFDAVEAHDWCRVAEDSGLVIDTRRIDDGYSLTLTPEAFSEENRLRTYLVLAEHFVDVARAVGE